MADLSIIESIGVDHMKHMYEVRRGKPLLGATVDAAGTNFGIFSRNGTKVYLEIFNQFYDEEPIDHFELDSVLNRTGDVWHIYVKDIRHGAYYGWRIDGPFIPQEGHRFNRNKLLMDPYAKAVAGTYDFQSESIYGYDKKAPFDTDLTFSKVDSIDSACKSIVIDDLTYDWEDDVHPRIPLQDTIIYEMHTRQFTRHPNSEVEHKGTFNGIIEKIPYLKELGITAVELLPIFEFNLNSIANRNPETGEMLRDVWGYNPIGFFAVTGNYTNGMRLGEQVFEFKEFIKKMHQAGLEVILDVVYNHTGEGNEYGPTVFFKGIDNSIYYILEQYNKRWYSNYSGTGNTLNCSHSVVKQLIMDSLRYWVTEMHVDGFRFDLAAILGRDETGQWIGDLSLLKDIADDPILSGSKLIAEGWDAAGGYYVGEFPVGWAEWNGKYRDTARQFIKGDYEMIGDLATRICGSPDLFGKYGRKPYHSVNFVTAHDGFTMWDLVSYNVKHNYCNGEGNRDGLDHNCSWNHGVEGETDNPQILALRKRQVKNFMVLMMVSQGIPMLLMGDEFCRTQQGNNNGYCHDNEITWVDWSRKAKFEDVFAFTKKIIAFRKEHHGLRREQFLIGQDLTGNGVKDITWHGLKAHKPDWTPASKTLAFMMSGEDFMDRAIPLDQDIYVAFNANHEAVTFELPILWNKDWYRVVDTFKEAPNDFLDEPKYIASPSYTVGAYSCIILIARTSKNIKSKK